MKSNDSTLDYNSLSRMWAPHNGFSCAIFFHLTEMIELDGDEVRISSRGRFAERDIVQVSFLALCICWQK